MNSNIIAVDAGGTKTMAALISAQGTVIRTAVTGPGNLLVSFEDATKEIVQSIHTILQKSDQVEHIVVGAAGLTRELEVKNRIQEETGISCSIVTDAELGYMSQMEGQEGIVTLAGTGSVIIAYRDGRFYQKGGWGHLLGDAGSAYDVSIEVVKKITHYLDGFSDETALVTKVMKQFQWKDPGDVKRFIYHHDKAAVSQISAVVFEAAQLGDHDAREMFHSAGRALAEQTILTADRLFSGKTPLIGMQGSMLRQNHYIQEAFEQTLRKQLPEVSFVYGTVDPVMGGYYFYYKGRERV